MAFTPFTANTTISADEINDNYLFAGQEDLLPRTGVSLAVDSATSFTLGDDSTRWKDTYVTNVNMTGELKNGLNLIAEVTLSTSATTVQISNLNGDVDEIYYIVFKGVSDLNVASGYYMSFNEDSTSAYGYQYIRGQNAVASALRSTSQTKQLIGTTRSGTSTADSCYSELWMYAKTGNERVGVCDMFFDAGGIYANSVYNMGVVWNNTSGTITTMEFSGGATTTAFVVGTNIQIWAKR